MSLLDEISAASKMRNRTCIVVDILDELAAEDARELQVALDDRAMTHTAIARVLAARGYPINPSGKQVAAHRRGTCSCR
ncbi:MAG: hypothetical protein EXQ67_08950 [Thermoleophilia bacterium]|nr:hypothetical protein [Thermoleophilia bacterium]